MSYPKQFTCTLCNLSFASLPKLHENTFLLLLLFCLFVWFFFVTEHDKASNYPTVNLMSCWYNMPLTGLITV